MPKDEAVSAGVVSGEIELILSNGALDRGEDTEATEERLSERKLLGRPRPRPTGVKFRLTDDRLEREPVDCVDLRVCRSDIGILLVRARSAPGR